MTSLLPLQMQIVKRDLSCFGGDGIVYEGWTQDVRGRSPKKFNLQEASKGLSSPL